MVRRVINHSLVNMRRLPGNSGVLGSNNSSWLCMLERVNTSLACISLECQRGSRASMLNVCFRSNQGQTVVLLQRSCFWGSIYQRMALSDECRRLSLGLGALIMYHQVVEQNHGSPRTLAVTGDQAQRSWALAATTGATWVVRAVQRALTVCVWQTMSQPILD